MHSNALSNSLRHKCLFLFSYAVIGFIYLPLVVIGIYAFTRAALARFVALEPSPLELREKLEQLRAIEDGMRIDVALVDSVPRGVDTPADLERARRELAHP